MSQLPVDRVPATLAWLGTFGALLTVVGVSYPGRTLFTLMFLMVTPAVCFAQLLPRLDPPARAVVSVVGGVTLVCAVAEVMLAAEWWSPRGGLIAVGVLCAALLGLALLLARRPGSPAKPAKPEQPAKPAAAPRRPANDDEDAWIYEE
jgi:hypothetical protein